MTPFSTILLAAGYATRLYPLTKETPKALLPLDGGVILDAIVRKVPKGGPCILVTNARFAQQFRAWQRQQQREVTILDDGTTTVETRLGAIRDLELARTRGGVQGDVLVIGTDNLFRWALEDFVAQAQRRDSAPSVALWQAPSAQDATQFGVVTLTKDGRISTFVEKSPTPPSTLVSTCVYYVPALMCGKIQEFLESRENADAPGFFIKWLSQRTPVYGVVMAGEWYDIGTIEAYEAIRAAWPVQEDR